MAEYPHSKHQNTSNRKTRGIKLARLNARRRISRNNQRHDARPKQQIKLKSSATLAARSEELLTTLLEQDGSPTTGHDIFQGMLNAKLSDKLRRMQRKHRQKALAVASAVYHIICRKNDSVAALHSLVNKMNVSPPRGSDPCRTIVECLFGSTKEERTHNRQYACADANALRYIVRKGIAPQKVLKPDEGQSITNWAKREANYRRLGKAFNTRSKVAVAKRSITSEWTDAKLPVFRPSEQRYRFLKKCARKGVFLVKPEDHGRLLAVTVTELTSLTVDEAKRRLDKVRAAIEKVLDKAIQKAAEKPPATPLMRRRVFDDRRSIPSGPHRLIHSKPVGAAPPEQLADAQTIESPNDP
jgi:hypothetical protein